jgi:RNA polymerase sigma-70 factor (ECF subfamily)
LVECQRNEATVRLRAALDRLPEKYRTVIHLRYLEYLSLSEVARRLGLTISAVKTRQVRAQQKMAKLLVESSQRHPRSRACR